MRQILILGLLLDAYRTVPRILLAIYTWQAGSLLMWAMALPDISGPQTAFVSTIWGVYPLLLNFYMQNSTDWEKVKSVSDSLDKP